MNLSPTLAAANEFIRDEDRRKARGQRTRFSTLRAAEVRITLDGFEKHALTEKSGHDNESAAIRGSRAVHIFGYRDSFDGQAETVIADILHAVEAQGKDPAAVLAQAFSDFNHERAGDRLFD